MDWDSSSSTCCSTISISIDQKVRMCVDREWYIGTVREDTYHVGMQHFYLSDKLSFVITLSFAAVTIDSMVLNLESVLLWLVFIVERLMQRPAFVLDSGYRWQWRLFDAFFQEKRKSPYCIFWSWSICAYCRSFRYLPLPRDPDLHPGCYLSTRLIPTFRWPSNSKCDSWSFDWSDPALIFSNCCLAA